MSTSTFLFHYGQYVAYAAAWLIHSAYIGSYFVATIACGMRLKNFIAGRSNALIRSVHAGFQFAAFHSFCRALRKSALPEERRNS